MQYQVRGKYIVVSIEVDGQKRPIYLRQSDNQPFIEGLWGVPYSIIVQKLVAGRVEVLTSVDGMNTLQEEEANFLTNGGLVISDSNPTPFTGWRLNDNETGQFVFKNPAQAMATMTTGSSRNVGVVGLAVYQEYLRPDISIKPSPRRPRSDQFSLGAEVKEMMFGGDMGTGIGVTITDKVGRTHFTRATSEPVEVFSIQYRSLEWLEQHGILTQPEPQAFPGNYPAPGQTGYGKYTSGLR